MKRLLIVGSGKRVQQAALPALQRLARRFVVQGLFARTEKTLEVEGSTYRVDPLGKLDASRLADADLVYVAVGKDAVPKVLAHLVALDVSRVDLLIDTPVVRFKHFRHAALLARFRNAWVAEDCAFLPWIDTVRAACAPGSPGSPGSFGPLGPLRRVVFHRSAYAYHGLATAKTLFDCDRIVNGRRKPGAGGGATRELVLPGDRRATIVEPRDYSVGHIVLEGERGTASDARGGAVTVRSDPAAKAARGLVAIDTIVEGKLCRGFRIGDVQTRLTDDEAELTRGDAENASLTARMESMKRVGFMRLLASIDEGRGAYPIQSGIDDMVVDYYLEKLGLWRATALTSPRSSLGRGLLNAISRLGG
jgi:hypothetical protein